MTPPTLSAWKFVKLAFSIRAESPSAHHILLVLANCANQDGYCYPAYEYLMEHTGYGSRQTVARALCSLRDDLGILTWKKGWGNQLRRQANGYRLDYEAMAALAKRQSDRGQSAPERPPRGLTTLPPESTQDARLSTLERATEYTPLIGKFTEVAAKSTERTLTAHNTTSHFIDRPILRNVSSNQDPIDSLPPKESLQEKSLEKESSAEEPSQENSLGSADGCVVGEPTASLSPHFGLPPSPGTNATVAEEGALMDRESRAAAAHEIGSLKWSIRMWEECSAPWLFIDKIRDGRVRIRHLEDLLATTKVGGTQ